MTRWWEATIVTFLEMSMKVTDLPEPPVGSVVQIQIPEFDPGNFVFLRYKHGWTEPGRDPDAPGFTYFSWAEVCSYGEPVLLVPLRDFDARVFEAMQALLDGTTRARVALLTGLSPEEINRLGGVEETQP
jgi:hypothetical protein